MQVNRLFTLQGTVGLPSLSCHHKIISVPSLQQFMDLQNGGEARAEATALPVLLFDAVLLHELEVEVRDKQNEDCVFCWSIVDDPIALVCRCACAMFDVVARKESSCHYCCCCCDYYK